MPYYYANPHTNIAYHFMIDKEGAVKTMVNNKGQELTFEQAVIAILDGEKIPGIQATDIKVAYPTAYRRFVAEHGRGLDFGKPLRRKSDKAAVVMMETLTGDITDNAYVKVVTLETGTHYMITRNGDYYLDQTSHSNDIENIPERKDS